MIESGLFFSKSALVGWHAILSYKNKILVINITQYPWRISITVCNFSSTKICSLSIHVKYFADRNPPVDHPQPAHLAVRLSVISDQSATLQSSKVTGDARRGHTNAGSQLVRTAALRLDGLSWVPNESREIYFPHRKFISRELTTLISTDPKYDARAQISPHLTVCSRLAHLLFVMSMIFDNTTLSIPHPSNAELNNSRSVQ